LLEELCRFLDFALFELFLDLLELRVVLEAPNDLFEPFFDFELFIDLLERRESCNPCFEDPAFDVLDDLSPDSISASTSSTFKVRFETAFGVKRFLNT
jgi:hypothetical protein